MTNLPLEELTNDIIFLYSELEKEEPTADPNYFIQLQEAYMYEQCQYYLHTGEFLGL